MGTGYDSEITEMVDLRNSVATPARSPVHLLSVVQKLVLGSMNGCLWQ